ncbi:hypothetical protein B7463_g7579, partial [Scytalidium lignicola]
MFVALAFTNTQAGSTPVNMRTDAMVTAAKFILHLEQTASEHLDYRIVGYLKAGHDSSNTMVSSVRLMVDLRHPSERNSDEIERGYKTFLSDLEAGQKD